MYHYVRPIKESQYPKIKGLELEGFVRQLNYFHKNFTFLSASNLIDAIYNTKEVPTNSMVLTFDDGFKDHFQYVFPILKKLKIQGLFFPPAKPILEKSVLDVHKIHFILANCSNSKSLLNEVFDLIEEYKKKYKLGNSTSYLRKVGSPTKYDNEHVFLIKRLLQKSLPAKARKYFVDYLFKKYVTDDEKSFSEDLYLSMNDIKEMKENGMYFGSHGYSHEWFENLEEKQLDLELKKSLKFLGNINENKETCIMCYPYGGYNDLTIKKIKIQGYKAALSVTVGDTVLVQENAFTLYRYDTNNFPQ